MITRPRFYDLGMSKDVLRAKAPAIFAEERSVATTSDRYTFIPTTEILDRLEDLNWMPVHAVSQRTKTRSSEFARHMIRLRRAEDIADYRLAMSRDVTGVLVAKPEYPEIILTNAHDGSAAFVFQAGIYRLVCSNGLVVAEASFASMRLTHRGNIGDLRSIVEQVNEQANRSLDVMNMWKQRELKFNEQIALAAAGAVLRWGEDTNRHPVRPEMLNRARRGGDNGADLWTTFNRVQENLLVGGQKDYFKNVPNKNGNLVPAKRSRAVTGISENIALNKGLWMLANKMYQGDTIASMN